jgi:hypothetical protein
MVRLETGGLSAQRVPSVQKDLLDLQVMSVQKDRKVLPA